MADGFDRIVPNQGCPTTFCAELDTELHRDAPFNIQAFRLAVLDAWQECINTTSREAEFVFFRSFGNFF